MIRPAKVTDAKAIRQLVNSYAEQGLMLSLSLHEIYDSMRDFSVIEREGEVVACCALHICWENLAEIRSLAVHKEYLRQGLGSKLLEHKLQEAHKLGISRIFALTYQPEFFFRSGFRTIDKSKLPHKIWADCIKCAKFPECDETALVYDFPHSN